MISNNIWNKNAFGSYKYLIFSGVIFIIFFITPLTPVEKMICKGLPKDALLLDLEFGYSFEKTYATLNNFNYAGRNTYFRNLCTVDMFFPIIYGIFLSILISFLLNKLKPTKQIFSYFYIFPFVISVFDILENILLVIIIHKYPIKLQWLVQISSSMTELKFISSFITIGIIVYLCLWIIYRRIAYSDIKN